MITDPRVTGIQAIGEDGRPVCAECGSVLFFARREAGAVLCGPCGRLEAGTLQPADHYHGIVDEAVARALAAACVVRP